MPKIVYHGTLSDAPPHDWLQETFHAGTFRAALDRIADEEDHGVDWSPGQVGIAQVHGYEISDDAPMSKREWADPDIGLALHHYEGAPPAVPEHKENRIYPYQNAREDYGSTSYVIPTNFVGNHVKHLGVQFQDLVGDHKAARDVYSAMSTMVGGKFK